MSNSSPRPPKTPPDVRIFHASGAAIFNDKGDLIALRCRCGNELPPTTEICPHCGQAHVE